MACDRCRHKRPAGIPARIESPSFIGPIFATGRVKDDPYDPTSNSDRKGAWYIDKLVSGVISNTTKEANFYDSMTLLPSPYGLSNDGRIMCLRIDGVWMLVHAVDTAIVDVS